MLNSVYCGSGTSCSSKTTSDTSRAAGSSSPVTETVGDDTPSPYFGDISRPYLITIQLISGDTLWEEFACSIYLWLAAPNSGFLKLLHVPSNVRYLDLVHDAGSAAHVILAALPPE